MRSPLLPRALAAAAAAAALVTLAAPAAAQGPATTGSFVGGRDVNWDVAVGTGPFVDAFQVVPSPWADDAGTGARWISYSTSGSSPGGTPYRFRTTFDLTGLDPATASLTFRCGMDDFTNAIRLNGVAASILGGGSCTFHALSPNRVVSSGFVAGVNTLEFEISGNQTTDGFIYHTVSFSAQPPTPSAVPEPSTYALMATGLAGLGFAARRRRGEAR